MVKKNKPDSLESIAKSCDEAEDLLESLEIKEKQQESTTYIYEENQEEVFQPALKNNEPWQSEYNGIGNRLFALIGFIIFVVVIAGIAEEQRQNASKPGIGNKSTSSAPFWKYQKALKTSSDAVLVSEHKNAIKEIKEVLNLGLDSSTMNRGLLNNRIIQAQKAIKYIDQEGESKYREMNDYGYQWYDEHTENAYKVFFAYSRRCKRPMITFKYLQGENGPIIRKKRKVPIGLTSTILVPYHENDNVWLGVDSFRCN